MYPKPFHFKPTLYQLPTKHTHTKLLNKSYTAYTFLVHVFITPSHFLRGIPPSGSEANSEFPGDKCRVLKAIHNLPSLPVHCVRSLSAQLWEEPRCPRVNWVLFNSILLCCACVLHGSSSERSSTAMGWMTFRCYSTAHLGRKRSSREWDVHSSTWITQNLA